MYGKVLFVDDDPEILYSFARQFRKDFEVIIAKNASEGFEKINENPDITLVISDMAMPEMDGILFLTRVKAKAPKIIRVMLTGYANLETAMHAVNNGNIFRFLTKPASYDVLKSTILDGIRQYRLEEAERTLLENTLNGSLSLLTEILCIVSPNAFGRSMRLKKHIQFLVTKLNMADAWQYELAATLSQIGFVSVPNEIIEKSQNFLPLSPDEHQMMENHAVVARRLLEKIPRLEDISKMVEYQNLSYDFIKIKQLPQHIVNGAQLIKLALSLDYYLSLGFDYPSIYKKLAEINGEFDPIFLSVIRDEKDIKISRNETQVKVSQLKTGMIFNRDVYLTNGSLLIKKGQEVSFAVLLRVKNFHLKIGLVEPIWVLVAAQE